jgi:hypothetical protein
MAGEFELSDCLNPQVLSSTADFARSFASAQPFRHVIMEQFLTENLCRRVCEQFPDFEASHAINENRQVGGKATRENVASLGSAFVELDKLAQSPDFLALIEKVTGVSGLYYDPYYFGGGTHENRHGQDLDPHIDFNYHPITHQHRRLNLIIYLNEEWEDDWGGALQLHRDPHLSPAKDQVVTVSPLMNRCVIFETTEHSWHGFERINLPEGKRNLSRKSFALYFYTDTRPAKETAGEHSTVYVERPLPERYQPGMTLGETELAEIRRLLSRRDQHLQRLYSEVQKLYGQLNQARYSGGNRDMSLKPEDIPADPQSAARMIKILRHRVNELENSSSWRITAPLRALKRLVSSE